MTGDPTRWELCVLCRRSRCLKHVATVIGPVCRACFADAHPESAPYWADHRRRTTPGQATTQRRYWVGVQREWSTE